MTDWPGERTNGSDALACLKVIEGRTADAETAFREAADGPAFCRPLAMLPPHAAHARLQVDADFALRIWAASRACNGQVQDSKRSRIEAGMKRVREA